MDNNLSTKLNTVENNISVMKTNWGLSKTDSIETLTETAQKYTPDFISFYNYSGDNLISLLKDVDTSKVTDMSYMFYGALVPSEALKYLDMSSVTNTSRMLAKLQNTEIDASVLDVTNVTNMNYMFANSSTLQKVDMSTFTGENVTHMEGMFNYSRALTFVDMRNFDFSKAIYSASMFYGVPSYCQVIVKDEEAKAFVKKQHCTNTTYITNVKTVAEYEAAQE